MMQRNITAWCGCTRIPICEHARVVMNWSMWMKKLVLTIPTCVSAQLVRTSSAPSTETCTRSYRVPSTKPRQTLPPCGHPKPPFANGLVPAPTVRPPCSKPAAAITSFVRTARPICVFAAAPTSTCPARSFDPAVVVDRATWIIVTRASIAYDSSCCCPSCCRVGSFTWQPRALWPSCRDAFVVALVVGPRS